MATMSFCGVPVAARAMSSGRGRAPLVTRATADAEITAPAPPAAPPAPVVRRGKDTASLATMRREGARRTKGNLAGFRTSSGKEDMSRFGDDATWMSEDYVAPLNAFTVRYKPSIGLGSSQSYEQYMGVVESSDLFPLLRRAAPFALVDEGPFGVNSTLLRLSTGEISDASLRKNFERELMHGRWAMLGVAGALGGDTATGIPWFNAGSTCTISNCTNGIGLGQTANYQGLYGDGTTGPVPFVFTTVISALLVGHAEAYRTGVTTEDGVRTGDVFISKARSAGASTIFPELNVGDVNPGGRFDPLNLDEYNNDAEKLRMRVREVRHCRLAMLAWLGFIAQSFATNDLAGGPGAVAAAGGGPEMANGPWDNWNQAIENWGATGLSGLGHWDLYAPPTRV